MRRSISLWEKLVADHPEVPGYRDSWAAPVNVLSNILIEAGRLPEAEKAIRQAVARMEKLNAENHPGTDYRQSLARCLATLGILLALPEINRLDEAWQVYGRALDLWQELVDGCPTDAFFRMRLALACDELGSSLVNHGQPVEGEASLRRSLAVRKQLVADYPNVPFIHMRLGGTLHELALAVLARGACAESWVSSKKTTRFTTKPTGSTKPFPPAPRTPPPAPQATAIQVACPTWARPPAQQSRTLAFAATTCRSLRKRFAM